MRSHLLHDRIVLGYGLTDRLIAEVDYPAVQPHTSS
jgi:hypothetical protein